MAKARVGRAATSPKLKPGPGKHLVHLRNDGSHTFAKLADLLDVGRSTT